MYIPITKYEDYLINESGEVFSKKSNRVLKHRLNTSGYKFVTFNYHGTQKHFLVHRLLAYVFLDLPSLDSNLEVDHIDSDKHNNSIENLQVLSTKEHKFKTHGEYSKSLEKYCFCGQKLSEFNTSGLCRTHWDEYRTSSDGITLEDIILEVTSSNWRKAGEKLGLSDNGLRKRYKKLSGGLNPKNIKFNHSS
jgi:hypothetical protein